LRRNSINSEPTEMLIFLYTSVDSVKLQLS
jgi:hypothetical protein